MKSGASDEIEETAELMQGCLKQLRSILSDQDSSFSCPTDDPFLLKFLRARKYNVDAAFDNIKKYFKARKEAPEIFDDYLPSTLLYDDICRKNKMAAVSRQRDQSGRGVLLLRAGPWDSTFCTMTEFIKACLILVEWLMLDEDIQRKGIVFVLDNSGIGLQHMTHLTPFLMKKIVDITEIHLLGYELNKLIDVVPADIIPKEAGGSFESYDYDALKRDLLSRNDYFKEVSQYGYGKENTYI